MFSLWESCYLHGWKASLWAGLFSSGHPDEAKRTYVWAQSWTECAWKSLQGVLKYKTKSMSVSLSGTPLPPLLRHICPLPLYLLPDTFVRIDSPHQHGWIEYEGIYMMGARVWVMLLWLRHDLRHLNVKSGLRQLPVLICESEISLIHPRLGIIG